MTLHSLPMRILETTLHQQDPRLKVERLWIAFPNRRIATAMEAAAAEATRAYTLIKRVSNSRCIC